MKALLIFTLTLTFSSAALTQELEATNLETSTNLETELLELNLNIDKYFQETLQLQQKLASLQLKSSHLKDQMPPEVAQSIETLENTKLYLVDAFRAYRYEIDELARNETTPSLENSKHLYNLALIKGLLPRYELAPKEGLISKLLSSPKAYPASEIIPRSEALSLIYSDFKTPSDKRVQEILDTHNRITSTFNAHRGSVLLQVYPKSAKTLPESALYRTIVRGEGLDSNKGICSKLF